MVNMNVVRDDEPLRGAKELTVDGVPAPSAGNVVADLYDL